MQLMVRVEMPWTTYSIEEIFIIILCDLVRLFFFCEFLVMQGWHWETY